MLLDLVLQNNRSFDCVSVIACPRDLDHYLFFDHNRRVSILANNNIMKGHTITLTEVYIYTAFISHERW